VEYEDIRSQALELLPPAVRAGASGDDGDFVGVILLKALDEIQVKFVGASDFEMGRQHQETWQVPFYRLKSNRLVVMGHARAAMIARKFKI
jgi:hypothetical protein